MRPASQRKRHALVTGATGGIGRELCALAARDGWSLILSGRDEPALERLRSELTSRFDVEAVAIARDLSRPGAADALHREISEEELAVDVLLHSAGIDSFSRFDELPSDTVRALVEVNVAAITSLTRLFLEPMIEREFGRILTIASTGAFKPSSHQAVYNASKAYLLSFSRALHGEVRPEGVTVTCLCPGPTRTGFFERAGIVLTSKERRALADPSAVARAGYRGLCEGRPVVIPGAKAKAQSVLGRWLPASVVDAVMSRRALSRSRRRAS